MRHLLRLVALARRGRGWHHAVILLRLLIGFAFLPAGIKKVLGQPFTDPSNHGRFHDFLHAFHATGGFYRFVGVVQLLAALLLMTQRRAGLGAALAAPVLTAIVAFCWSTGVVPTAIVATLMWLGTLALLAWDLPRWWSLGEDRATDDGPASAALGAWAWCGLAVLALYLAVSVASGGAYRPRGVDTADWRWWSIALLPALPIVTAVRVRRRAGADRARGPR
jgi:hypothetical protein